MVTTIYWSSVQFWFLFLIWHTADIRRANSKTRATITPRGKIHAISVTLALHPHPTPPCLDCGIRLISAVALSKCYCGCLIYTFLDPGLFKYPRGPNCTPFRSMTSPFRDTRLSKIGMHRKTPEWPQRLVATSWPYMGYLWLYSFQFHFGINWWTCDLSRKTIFKTLLTPHTVLILFQPNFFHMLSLTVLTNVISKHFEISNLDIDI